MIKLGEPGLKIGCYFICENQYVRELDKMKNFKNLITDLVLSDCKNKLFSKTHLVLKSLEWELEPDDSQNLVRTAQYGKYVH
jgi:hypothetical protein